MKPAKLVQKSGIPASFIIPVGGFPGLQRPQSGEFSAHRKNSAVSKMTNNHTVRDGCRDQTTISADRGTNNRNLRVAQTSLMLLQVSKDYDTYSLKNSGSVSPSGSLNLIRDPTHQTPLLIQIKQSGSPTGSQLILVPQVGDIGRILVV